MRRIAVRLLCLHTATSGCPPQASHPFTILTNLSLRFSSLYVLTLLQSPTASLAAELNCFCALESNLEKKNCCSLALFAHCTKQSFTHLPNSNIVSFANLSPRSSSLYVLTLLQSSDCITVYLPLANRQQFLKQTIKPKKCNGQYARASGGETYAMVVKVCSF